MGTIELTPEAVVAYKEIMTNPKKHGLEMPSLEECFEDAEEGTAKHLLFKEYIDRIRKPLSKVFFYIVMDEIYWDKHIKCADGNYGYKLKIRTI